MSADTGTPRVCAPYKTTTYASVDNATACTSDSQCTTGPGICNNSTNNFNPGGVYGANAGIFGPNGKCRQLTWALDPGRHVLRVSAPGVSAVTSSFEVKR